MEHLSAEERACLMYLEETIESLEVQEDSGLSNDEPDSAISRLKSGNSGKVQISVSGGGIHTVQVDGGATFPSKAPAGPGSRELNNEHKTEQHASDQTSEPQLTSAAKPKDSEMLLTQLRPPVTDSATACIMPTPDTQTDILCVFSDGDPESVPTDAKLCPDQSSKPSSELDLGLIPPPSDFRDEPLPQPEKDKVSLPPAGTPNKTPVTSIDPEQLRQKASEKKPPVSSSVTLDFPNKPPSEPSVGSAISPSPDASEPRSPPAVLPKPKKLPANIILKSHKTSVGGSDASSGHSAPSSADRLLLDPQRVRMEALRKLGLLKSEECESGPALSPRLSPKSRRSWAAPSTPLSPLAPNTPTPPSTPSYPHVSSTPPTSAPVSSPAPVTASPSVSSTPPAVPLSDILPAPAAFSDPVAPMPSHNELSAVKDVSEDTVTVSPAALANQLTPPKAAGVQSHSLEHSGLGQESSEGSEKVDTKHSLIQLRNSRPRPASLGSGREFSSAQGEGSQASGANDKDPDSRRSLSPYTASHHSDNLQKLPRSQGISVLICPRAQNEEDRRVALKKLGLLRD
ncbi:specifically androgen-regulated gene protein isoform X2 [Sphaeramia orbicularis]|nr:specifically androgen-regulated gene protein-like isoform X2 [Sphaeramia orbicularis]